MLKQTGVEFDQFRYNTDYGIIKVKIWDTVGHERIRSVNSIHYKEAIGALLIADLSIHPTKKDQSGENKEILEDDLTYWMNEFRSKADLDAQLILVGNKVDKEEQPPSTLKILEDFSEKHNLKFFKTSAMMGTNVQEVMSTLVDQVGECYFKDPAKAAAYQLRKSKRQKMAVEKEKPSKKCC